MKTFFILILLLNFSNANAFKIKNIEYNFSLQRCGIVAVEGVRFEIGDKIELEGGTGKFKVVEIRIRKTYHGVYESYCAEELK